MNFIYCIALLIASFILSADIAPGIYPKTLPSLLIIKVVGRLMILYDLKTSHVLSMRTGKVKLYSSRNS